ncbi:MAG: bifunctional glutamate N-acetyltransferase/amino-acid acetyltransferase ArgJ [bacterium]
MNGTTRSPLAPAIIAELPSVGGVNLGAVGAGIKYKDRNDLMLIEFVPDTTVSGVLTRSTTASAPVIWCRENLAQGRARGLIVNSGNANAFTGTVGTKHVKSMCSAVASCMDCDPAKVFIASTGVIGEFLPIDNITSNIEPLHRSLSTEGWKEASEAIMTTDTFPKVATRKLNIAGTPVVLNGFAKGSGMIEPDMATMLAFIFTDAAIPRDILQLLLVAANENSFNAITVDSDTSTSDTCLMFATGAAGNPLPDSVSDPVLKEFLVGVADLMQDLAIQVVKDGEGATKLIKVTVTGAEDDRCAKRIAKAIANSPLVKTAIAGEDANWGRVVMAVGKSGEKLSMTDLKISFGGVLITKGGRRVDDYEESQVTQHLKGQEIELEVDLGVGTGNSVVWTCDLTHGYISINADYRS